MIASEPSVHDERVAASSDCQQALCEVVLDQVVLRLEIQRSVKVFDRLVVTTEPLENVSETEKFGCSRCPSVNQPAIESERLLEAPECRQTPCQLILSVAILGS